MLFSACPYLKSSERKSIGTFKTPGLRRSPHSSNIYEMFVKMRFLTAEQVEYPPHTGSKALDVNLITEVGLGEDAISLLQQLPYIADRKYWKHGEEDSVFLNAGGVFLDYRARSEPEDSRDPLWLSPDETKGWGEKDGPYMRPWYMPLNTLGNHGSMMIISMRSRTWPNLS